MTSKTEQEKNVINERKVFYVDIGNMTTAEATEHLKAIKAEIQLNGISLTDTDQLSSD